MNSKKIKIFLVALLVFSFCFIVQKEMFAAETQTQPINQVQRFEYKMLESFPGFFNRGDVAPDLPNMILAIYKFGIWTVGIAGLLMLTIGGIMYMGSAGNNAAATTAKTVITDSLLGIVAALGAYLFMYVINPDLTKIDFSRLTATTVTETKAPPPSATVPDGGVCSGTSVSCCSSDTKIKCTTCQNCVSFTNSYPSLCYNKSKDGKSNTGCQLNSTLASKLLAANLESYGAQVSEAWPPSVTHSDPCHADGTCADVRCKNGCVNESIASIKKIYDAIKNVGLSTVFEHTDCAPYTAAGINCKRYPTMTAPSFHVEL